MKIYPCSNVCSHWDSEQPNRGLKTFSKQPLYGYRTFMVVFKSLEQYVIVYIAHELAMGHIQKATPDETQPCVRARVCVCVFIRNHGKWFAVNKQHLALNITQRNQVRLTHTWPITHAFSSAGKEALEICLNTKLFFVPHTHTHNWKRCSLIDGGSAHCVCVHFQLIFNEWIRPFSIVKGKATRGINGTLWATQLTAKTRLWTHWTCRSMWVV